MWGRIARRLHLPQRGRRHSGFRQLSVPGAQAFGGRAGNRAAELPDSPPDDGDPGPEHGFGEGHPSAHLRHSRPDTTANEYMQALPASVQQMVGSVYLMLTKEARRKSLKTVFCRFATKCHKLFNGTGCKSLILWWAQQDSNLRLPPCEGGTLPLSYAPNRSRRHRTSFRRIIFVKNIICRLA